jgi:hypothetical protein
LRTIIKKITVQAPEINGGVARDAPCGGRNSFHFGYTVPCIQCDISAVGEGIKWRDECPLMARIPGAKRTPSWKGGTVDKDVEAAYCSVASLADAVITIWRCQAQKMRGLTAITGRNKHNCSLQHLLQPCNLIRDDRTTGLSEIKAPLEPGPLRNSETLVFYTSNVS